MAIRILRPNAEGDYTAWTLGAGTSKVAAVDPGDPISHDDLTSYVKSIIQGDKQSFKVGNKPKIGRVNGLKIGTRSMVTGNVTQVAFARLGTTDGSEVLYNPGNSVWGTNLVDAPRPGGGSWSVADINDATLQVCTRDTYGDGVTEFRFTSMWFELDYTPAIGTFASTEAVRDAISRRLQEVLREGASLKGVEVSLEQMDLELVDDLSFSHFAGPSEDGDGWGILTFERRHFIVGAMDDDVGGRRLYLDFKEVRR